MFYKIKSSICSSGFNFCAIWLNIALRMVFPRLLFIIRQGDNKRTVSQYALKVEKELRFMSQSTYRNQSKRQQRHCPDREQHIHI